MTTMRVIFILLLSISSNSFAQIVGITMKSGDKFESTFVSCSKDEIVVREGPIPSEDVSMISFTTYAESKSTQYSTMRSAGIRVTYDYRPGASGKWKLRDEDIIDDLPVEDGTIVFSEVVALDSVPARDIYLRAKTFFVDHFRSAKDVIQLDDKDDAIVVGKGWQDIYIKMTLVTTVTTAVQMWYKIKVQGRFGRYKYDIYGFEFTNYATQYVASETISAEMVFRKSSYFTKKGTPRSIPLEYKSAMLAAVNQTIAGLKQAMTKGSKGKDDW